MYVNLKIARSKKFVSQWQKPLYNMISNNISNVCRKYVYIIFWFLLTKHVYAGVYIECNTFINCIMWELWIVGESRSIIVFALLLAMNTYKIIWAAVFLCGFELGSSVYLLSSNAWDCDVWLDDEMDGLQPLFMICHCFMTGTIFRSSSNVCCLQCDAEIEMFGYYYYYCCCFSFKNRNE